MRLRESHDYWSEEAEKSFIDGVSRYRNYDRWLSFAHGYLNGLDMRHVDFDGNPITRKFKPPIIYHICMITENKRGSQ